MWGGYLQCLPTIDLSAVRRTSRYCATTSTSLPWPASGWATSLSLSRTAGEAAGPPSLDRAPIRWPWRHQAGVEGGAASPKASLHHQRARCRAGTPPGTVTTARRTDVLCRSVTGEGLRQPRICWCGFPGAVTR